VRSGTGSLLNESTAAGKQQKTWPPRQMLMRVAAGGDGTSDRTGFVVVIGQATVLAAVNQHVRSAIRDEASKPKLVLLPCFRSVFFSINLVNVTILRFVV
jgi:hypothetical protein